MLIAGLTPTFGRLDAMRWAEDAGDVISGRTVERSPATGLSVPATAYLTDVSLGLLVPASLPHPEPDTFQPQCPVPGHACLRDARHSVVNLSLPKAP